MPLNCRPAGLEETELTSGWYPLSLNTLQQVEAGQRVTVEWTGRDSSTFIFDTEARGAIQR